MSREQNEFYRFRTGYLKFKSALCDRNTGLLAYPLLLDEVRRFFESRDRIAVVVVRVADIEKIEAVYGWQSCDDVLRRAANVLRATVAARIGSDALLSQDGVHQGRFVVFAPAAPGGAEVTAFMAAETAESLRSDLQAAFAGPEFAGLSPGLAFQAGARLLTDNPSFRFERLVSHAVAAALPGAAAAAPSPDLEKELRQILRDGALEVVYQPILTLAGRQVVGYEALVRGPAGTLLETPALLFSWGEQLGLSGDLDLLCRRRALESARSLADGQMLFVNCLPGALAEGSGADEGLSALMARTGCPPERLVLEVAEQRLENGGRPSPAGVAELRKLGVRLAMDRAGSGFSTLKLLDDLKPEYIKIEPTLVRGLDANLVQQEVARSLVAAAQRIGATVVAAGIESEAEADAARRCGVDLAQGFHLARPHPGPAAPDPEPPRGAPTV